MASHLMLIKTKMLLSAAEAAEAQSELDVLRQSLIERQRREALDQIRMAVTVLEPRNEVGRCLFVKQPEPLRRDATYRYRHESADMLRALDEIAERSQRRLPPPTVNFKGIVGKEPYPVTRKATEVIRNLVLRGIERLKNLFKGSKTRSEIVATFLAVLELCKTNSVSLEDDISGENPNVRLIKDTQTTMEEEPNGTN
jgi:segregation and condensation protein A